MRGGTNACIDNRAEENSERDASLPVEIQIGGDHLNGFAVLIRGSCVDRTQGWIALDIRDIDQGGPGQVHDVGGNA